MDKVVARLDRILSVQDIMTRAEALERADSIEEATRLFKEYDVVPYPKTGKIEGFFQRKVDELISLKPDHLISNATSLLNMPRLLDQALFRFVISTDKIDGYVHYSDLNKPAMKVPLFVLIQAKEKNLWDRIKDQITEDIVHKVLPDKARGCIKKRNAARKSNVDIGWTGAFSLPSILRLARYFKATDLSDDQIELLRLTRNDVAHSDKNLVDRHSDVSQLVAALKLCQSALKSK